MIEWLWVSISVVIFFLLVCAQTRDAELLDTRRKVD